MLDIFHTTDQKWQRFVVDIWQGRVDNSNKFVYTDADHPYYRHGGLQTFFEFRHGTNHRQTDRSLIGEARDVN